MTPDDPIDEKTWLRALKLDNSPPPEQADPSPARVDALLRNLPASGEIPPSVLEATERAWRAEAVTEPAARILPMSTTPARRNRWTTWGPALAAAATFVVLLVRPILFVNPLQWQTAVAVASVRGETGDTPARREAMQTWMGRLEDVVRERASASGKTIRAEIKATLDEMPDGVMHLRVELGGEASTPPLEAWIPPPLTAAAAETALQKMAGDIFTALTANATTTQ